MPRAAPSPEAAADAISKDHIASFLKLAIKMQHLAAHNAGFWPALEDL